MKYSQKAPSAKRCIKTLVSVRPQRKRTGSQKAPSAKRCIKTPFAVSLAVVIIYVSESTERQKVH